MKILPVRFKNMAESAASFFIELYTINLTTGIIRLCNCDKVITYNGNDYQPVPVQRGSIKSSVDSKIDNVELKIADTDLSKISALINGFDFRGCYCEIDRIQYPDSIYNPELVMLVFYGYLDTPTYSNGEFTVQIKASLPYTNKPNRTTQYYCNSIFGDEECKLSKSPKNIQIDTYLSKPNKIFITTDMSEFPIGYYAGGLLTIGYETKVIQEDYYPEGQPLRLITTTYPFEGTLQANGTLERNCDKTPETCRKYNNMKNYGGFLSVPKEYRLG